MEPDQIRVLALVAQRLEALQVPYVVSGSIALEVHGFPRATADIDVVLELELSQVGRLVAAFGADFSCDEDEVREAIRFRKMFNLIHLETLVKVDGILRKPTAFQQEMFARRQRRRVPGTTQDVWMITAEDLVIAKLSWASDSHSELQLRDVRGILDLVPNLDTEYLEHWTRELGLQGLLEEVRDAE